MVADDHLNFQRLGAGLDDGNRLRMAACGDEEGFLARFAAHGVGQRHGLGGGGALVEQRGVGNVEAGEVADHRLEIDQGFETALGDFSLIGGIGGVPAGIFEDVALDDAGGQRVGVAGAEVGAENLVAGGDVA